MEVAGGWWGAEDCRAPGKDVYRDGALEQMAVMVEVASGSEGWCAVRGVVASGRAEQGWDQGSRQLGGADGGCVRYRAPASGAVGGRNCAVRLRAIIQRPLANGVADAAVAGRLGRLGPVVGCGSSPRRSRGSRS